MPNPRVVSDTSPLLYLGRIGQLELLPRLFSEVCVPEQVALELDAGRLIRIWMQPEPKSSICIPILTHACYLSQAKPKTNRLKVSIST